MGLPDYGILYWFSPLLCVVGVAALVGRSIRGGSALVRFVGLVYRGSGTHGVRFGEHQQSHIAMLPWCAVRPSLAALWRHRSIRHRAVLAFRTVVDRVCLELFRVYREQAAPAFFASFGEAIRYASAQTDGEICITSDVNMPYIFVLFANQEDPHVFYQTVRYENPGAEFQSVASFSRYRFGMQNCGQSAKVLLVTHEEEQRFGGEGLGSRF